MDRFPGGCFKRGIPIRSDIRRRRRLRIGAAAVAQS